MDPLVDVKIRTVTKALSTLFTFIRFLYSMYSLMSMKL
jgi:hypothetical protein